MINSLSFFGAAMTTKRRYRTQPKKSAQLAHQRRKAFDLMKEFVSQMDTGTHLLIKDAPETAVVNGKTLTFSCKPNRALMNIQPHTNWLTI